jgi:hypothetical protein
LSRERKRTKEMPIGVHVPPAWLSIPRKVEIKGIWSSRQAKNVLHISRNRARADFNPKRQSALDEFLRLAEPLERRDSNLILAFVKKWGVLNLCKKHPRFPFTHQKRTEACRVSNEESLDVWRGFVIQARDALMAALELREHRVSAHDRREMDLMKWQTPDATRKDLFREHADEKAARATEIVSRWLRDSGLVLVPYYTYGRGFSLTFEHGGRLFDLLTAQLLMAVAGASALGLCAACGRLFRLEHRRKPGHRTFCPQMSCQRIANKMWVRESRLRASQSKSATGKKSRITVEDSEGRKP